MKKFITILAIAVALIFATSCSGPEAKFKLITNNTTVVEAAGSSVSVYIPADWPDIFNLPFAPRSEIPMSYYTTIVDFYSEETDESYIVFNMYIGTVEKFKIVIFGLFYNDQYYGIEEDNGYPMEMTLEEFNILKERKMIEAQERSLATPV